MTAYINRRPSQTDCDRSAVSHVPAVILERKNEEPNCHANAEDVQAGMHFRYEYSRRLLVGIEASYHCTQDTSPVRINVRILLALSLL